MQQQKNSNTEASRGCSSRCAWGEDSHGTVRWQTGTEWMMFRGKVEGLTLFLLLSLSLYWACWLHFWIVPKCFKFFTGESLFELLETWIARHCWDGFMIFIHWVIFGLTYNFDGKILIYCIDKSVYSNDHKVILHLLATGGSLSYRGI